MKKLLIALIATVTLWSCAEDGTENGSNKKGHANMQVILVDNPADYDAVFVEVIGFEYKIDTTTSEMDEEDDDDLDSLDNEADDRIASDGDDGSWVTVDIEPTVYDLLELNNGSKALLADIDIPVGEFEEVRVILGNDNSLVMGEDTVTLTTPSGQTSGIKLKVDGTVEDGKYYRLVLDFDAAKSVVEAGKSGKYLLKPVIYADLNEVALEEIYGTISGFVYPAPDSVGSVAYLVQGEDSLSTFPESASGYFAFDELLPGTFNLSIVPADSSLSTIMVDDITVGEAEMVELDTLNF